VPSCSAGIKIKEIYIYGMNDHEKLKRIDVAGFDVEVFSSTIMYFS